MAVTVLWRALTASWRQKGKRKQVFPRAIRTTELPSNPSPLHSRRCATDISEQPDPNLTDLFDTWHHATMAANVAVREGKCSTTSGTSLLRRQQGENRFPSVNIFITIHQPKSFLRNFGPERKSMPAPSRRDVFFSGTMLTLVCPFIYIYTWASIHTTIIFKTGTEVLSIVLHTSSRNTQPCLVCCLKGKTSFFLTCKVKNGQIWHALSLTTLRPPPTPHLLVFSGIFWRGIPLCTNFTATAASTGRPPKFVLVTQSSRGIDLALFERSEFLIDASQKKSLRVCSTNLGFSVGSANRIRPKHGIPLHSF